MRVAVSGCQLLSSLLETGGYSISLMAWVPTGLRLELIRSSVARFFENLVVNKKVVIFATEKVLLGSEGPSSTKAVHVA